MKNKYMTFVALAAAALATSCTSDDLAEQQQEQKLDEPQTVTLTAAVNEEQTRVGMKKVNSSSASFYWHNGDKILVQIQKGTTSTYGGVVFSTTAATGATSADFTGEVATGYKVAGYAVYPYNSSMMHSFTGQKALTFVLPSSYTGYKPATKIFGTTGAYPSNNTNMPMLGTISSHSISFKHLGGLAVIRVDKMPITSGTLTVTADQQLCGNFTVNNLSASGAKITTPTATATANNSVTFTFSGATQNAAGVFYLPLATGSYNNFQVTLSNGSDYNQSVSYGTQTISRAGITAVPVVAYVKVNGHWFADLGLSVLWATMNVGASKAEEAGGYYAWGEKTTKTNYNSSTYTSSLTSKYTTDGQTLAADDDVATATWKSPCRMPTKTEMTELFEKCTWTWNDTDKGYTVQSKTNGNSIFLYAGGYKSLKGFQKEKEGCYYWTSEAAKVGYAYYLRYSNSTTVTNMINNSETYCGDPIRPVAKKQ